MLIDPSHLNLRHLRAFSAVCAMGSVSAAAGAVHLSQPAITHAIRGLEQRLTTRLFHRGARGMRPTPEARAFCDRVDRALDLLNAGRGPSGRGGGPVGLRATAAHLRSLIALAETGSYTAAARSLGIEQPTVSRAARQLETALGVPLIAQEGEVARLTRDGARLERGARLMFSELEQGLSELASALGQERASIRVGALPLARATLLPHAIDAAVAQIGHLAVHVDDGPFPDLLHAVRNGSLDILLGALRDPLPARDVVQSPLFESRLGIFCGPGHPLLRCGGVGLEALLRFPWVLPRPGTPTRAYFDSMVRNVGAQIRGPIVETSSMVLVRELLQSGPRLTLISRAQVRRECAMGLLYELPFDVPQTPRKIGLLRRANWYPTREQTVFLTALEQAGGQV